jgi:dipeptide/tripeptide permease
LTSLKILVSFKNINTHRKYTKFNRETKMDKNLGCYLALFFGTLLIIAGVGISLIAARADIVVDFNAPLPGTSYPYALPYGIPILSIGIVLVIIGVVLLKYKRKKTSDQVN